MRRDYGQRLVRVNKRGKSMVMIITFIGTSEIIYSHLGIHAHSELYYDSSRFFRLPVLSTLVLITISLGLSDVH